MLAFFIECACPPGRRSATVGAGDIRSVEEFIANYSLTHIVCDACNTYYRLIGFIDDAGVECRVGAVDTPSSVPADQAGKATGAPGSRS